MKRICAIRHSQVIATHSLPSWQYIWWLVGAFHTFRSAQVKKRTFLLENISRHL